MNSIKTTVMGIASILVALGSAALALVDDDPTTVVNIEATIAAVIAGIGLIMARDNSKTSEEDGAK
jgi:hypothetical protein